MKYLKHNFVTNFHNATMMGDQQAAKEMLLSELADIIMQHKDMVISDLQAVGVKVPVNATDKQLGKLVIENLDKKDLQQHISETLIHHHQMHGLNSNGIYDMMISRGGEDLNLDGEVGAALVGVGKDIGGGALSGGTVGAVAGGVKSVADLIGKGKDKQMTQEQTKQQLIALLTAKQNAKNYAQTTKRVMSPWAITGIIVGGALLAAGIGYGIYKATRK